MRLTTVLVVAFAISVAAASFVATRDEFEAFKRKYNKHYSSTVEEQKRMGIFQKNMIRAAELNKANPQARFGDSPFADMTPEEFKVYHNADKHYAARVEELKREGGSANYHPLFPQDVVSRVQASSIDWRAKGAVTHVKNQGQCGSCWAFSTTGGIEGQWFLAGNTLTSLSEQELVSCDTIDSGCNGGLMNSAMDWLLSAKEGAIVTEESYPYVSGGGSAPACQKNKGTKGATIKGHFNVYHSEEQMLAWMSTTGPLSLAVDATAWQLYSGGIMTNCGGTSLDHGVLIVGYTATGNTPYWIFKNSWGASWGEEGYIYIKYGDNQCLLTHYPVSSIVKGDGPAPTPLPNSGYVTYGVFDDAGCTTGNQSFVFATGTCVSWDGASWEATCSGSTIEFTTYAKSLTCTGESRKVTKSVGQCGDDQADFLYYKYGCHAGTAPTQESSLQAKNHFVNSMKRNAH